MRLTTLLFGPTERSTVLFRVIVICLSVIAYLPGAPNIGLEPVLIWAGYFCLAGLLSLRRRPLGVPLALLVALVDVGAISVLAALAPAGAPPLWPLYFFAIAAAAISGGAVVAATAVLAVLGWTVVSWTSVDMVGVVVAWPAALLVGSALAVVLLSGRWAVEHRNRQVWQETALMARSLWLGDEPDAAASTIAETFVRLARAKHGWVFAVKKSESLLPVGASLAAPRVAPPADVVLATLGSAAGVLLSGEAWTRMLDGRMGEAVALRREGTLVSVLVLVWDELPSDIVVRRTAARSLSIAAADALRAAADRADARETLRLESALGEATRGLASTLNPAEVSAIAGEAVSKVLGAKAGLLTGNAAVRAGTLAGTSIPVGEREVILAASREGRSLSIAENEWLKRLAEVIDRVLHKCEEYESVVAELKRVQASLESLPAPAFVTRQDGSVFLANAAYRALLRIDASLPGRLGRQAGAEEEVVVGNPPRTFAVNTVSFEGNLSATIFREVTREREALRVKDELIAMAGHELRSPLTSISGYSQMMARQLMVVQRQIGQLDQLIGDFMEASSFEDAHLSLDFELLDVRALASAAVERLAGAHPERPVRLEMTEVPEIEADPARLGQVLDNLLNNANKYCPDEHAEIVLEVSVADGHVLVCVRDNGVGIEPEHLPLLFDRFYRVRSAETQGVKGLGLGLSIVRDLVVAHGGTVWAESAGVGQGSAFFVKLPVSRELPARLPLRKTG